MNIYGIWTKYSSNNSPLPSTTHETLIGGLAVGPNGRVWATVLGQETLINNRRITSRAWMQGILLFDNDRWTWFPWDNTGLPQHYFDSHVVCDSVGHLWLFGAVVARFDGAASEVFHTKERGLPPAPLVNSRLAAGHGKEMWLTTRLRGIYRFNGNDWQEVDLGNTEFHHVPVYDVRVDQLGRVWLALWLGKEVSFVWYNESRWEEYIRIPANKMADVLAFMIDPKGKLWVGWSEAGLWVLDQPGGKWVKYTIENSALPSDRIESLEIDRSGRVWVGAGDGIAVFDDTESACWWKIRPGIPDKPLSQEELRQIRQSGEGPVANISYPTVFDEAVLDTQGRIWASSGNGISVFAEQL